MWIVALLLAVTLSGCSSLILRPDDTAAETTGKVAVRALLLLPTVFTSEVAINRVKQREAYADWYMSLSDKERAREERWQARNAPIIIGTIPSLMPYQLPASRLSETMRPMMRPPSTCQTYTLGTTYQTTCY